MAPKKFSLEHRVFIFECYIKKKNCGAVRRRFARKFPDDPIPSKVTILNLVKKFRETGSLLNKCGKRDPSVLTKAKLYEIKDRLEHSPRNSLRLLSQETGVSKTTAFRATKALKLKPNKVTTVQELHAIDSTVGGPSNGKKSKSAKRGSKSRTNDLKDEPLSPSYDNDIESKDNVGESTDDDISESKIPKVEVKIEPLSVSSSDELQVTKKELESDNTSESEFPLQEILHVDIKNEPQSPSYADK